jgi:carboxypeptidase A2
VAQPLVNLAKQFDSEYDQLEKNSIFEAGNDADSFKLSEYHGHSEINAFLESTAKKYSNIATVQSIGQSYEKRSMLTIKIGAPGQNKKAVLIDCGIHAREWIAPAVCVYLVHALTSQYGKDKRITELLDSVDVYVLPVVNPDGYEYSRTRGHRLWRKTRSKTGSRRCIGVDPNRNFPYKFGGQGTSRRKCSVIYRGPSAASEVEVQNVMKLMRSLQPQLKAYVATHSAAKMWLVPWGYKSPAQYPDDFDELNDVAKRAVAALKKVHGVTFRPGNSVKLLGAAAGAADDFAKSIGVKYAFTAELRSGRRNIFVLPPEQIVPSGEEMLQAYLVVMDAARSA